MNVCKLLKRKQQISCLHNDGWMTENEYRNCRIDQADLRSTKHMCWPVASKTRMADILMCIKSGLLLFLAPSCGSNWLPGHTNIYVNFAYVYPESMPALCDYARLIYITLSSVFSELPLDPHHGPKIAHDKKIKILSLGAAIDAFGVLFCKS